MSCRARKTTPYRHDGQCITNTTISNEVKKRCNDKNVESLRNLYMDAPTDTLSSMFDRVQTSHPFIRWLALEDFRNLVSRGQKGMIEKEKKCMYNQLQFALSLSQQSVQLPVKKRSIIFAINWSNLCRLQHSRSDIVV